MLRKMIAERIREMRIKKGMTQESLAELADITSSHLAKIEREHNINVSIDLLDKIIEALGVTYDEFFTFGDASDDMNKLMYALSMNKNREQLLKSFIDIASLSDDK